MSSLTSIDVLFSCIYSPKDILSMLMDGNWNLCTYGNVEFVESNDDDFNWKIVPYNKFNIEKFLSSHDKFDRIVIVLTIIDEIGAQFLIYKDRITILFSINTIYLDTNKKLPSFDWYLQRLDPFLVSIDVASIQCEIIY